MLTNTSLMWLTLSEESLNSDGEQFNPYQQNKQTPLISYHIIEYEKDYYIW